MFVATKVALWIEVLLILARGCCYVPANQRNTPYDAFAAVNKGKILTRAK